MKRFLKLATGITITVIAVMVFFKSVGDFSELTDAIKRVRPSTLAAVALLSVVALFFRAIRLKIVLGERPEIKSSGLFSIITASYMLNNVLPFRIGEVARVVLVARKCNMSIATSLGSLISERVLDTAGYAVLLVLPALSAGLFSSPALLLGIIPVSKLLYLVAFGFFAIIICAVLFATNGHKITRLLAFIRSRVPQFLGKLFLQIDTMLGESSLWLSNPLKVFQTIILTFASILCYSVCIFLIAKDMEPVIKFSSAAFTSGLIAFGVAIPSAPGYAGTLDLAMQAGLLLFNMGKESATATAIIYHITGWVAVVAAGLAIWPKLNISISEIRRSA